MRQKNRFLTLAAALMLAIGVGQFVAPSSASAAQTPLLSQLNAEISDVVEEVQPAVVRVVSTKILRQRVADPFEQFERFFGPNFNHPLFDRRQNQPRERQIPQTGLGSGFIMSSDGLILTNNHVVGGADKLQVFLQDGSEYEAKVVGTDPESEVAVIRIDADRDLPYLELGDSDELKVGNLVLAIGNPQGLDQTVTFGIVSALNRSNVRITSFADFIQTDAAINPGNSGGPLLDIEGRVVGINTAIFSTSGGSQGMGFAIPINQADQIARILQDKGEVQRGYIGIQMDDLSPELAEHLDAEGQGGAVVVNVLPDTPAEGKLQTNDAIIGLNGEELRDSLDLRNKVASIEPGEDIRLEIVRDGKRRKVEVALAQRPGQNDMLAQAQGDDQPQKEKTDHVDLGFTVRPLKPEEAQQLGYDEGRGLLVTEVDEDSVALDNGIQQGMVILQVNQRDVGSVEDLHDALKAGRKKSTVLLLIATPRGNQLLLLPRE